MASFIADYHETEEAFPLVYDLGRVSLEWNMIEQFFTATIWELLGDYRTGMAVTSGMGNTSKADVVLRLTRERVHDADVLQAIEFACKAFNVLRENRNILIHSHSIFRSEKGAKPHWRRATGKGPEGHLSAEADLADLEKIIADICSLGLFIVALTPFLHRRRKQHWPGKTRPELPAQFPMPSLLKQPAPAGPDDAKGSALARKPKRKISKHKTS